MRTRVIASLCFLVLPFAANASDTLRFADTPSVAVIGHAEEEHAPDTITVEALVSGTGLTADLALKDLDRRVTRALEAIRKSGFKDEDTQSSGPTTEALYKRFYDDSGREIMEKRQPNGFRATYRITLKSTSLETVGAVLPKLTEAEATIDGITFAVSTERSIQERLDDAAVTDAVARAKRQIAAAGGKPGRVLSIGEPAFGDEGEADLAAKAPAAMKREPYTANFTYALRPGKQTISADRRVVVEILPQ